MKKAQVQMMETLAVLLIFFVLVVLGIMFYARVAKSNVQQELETSLQLNAIAVAQRASSLPELQCSTDNIVTENCLDLFKLEAAAPIIASEENEIHYYDRLVFSTITVKEVYPGNREWILYSRPLANFNNKIVTNIPISLLDPISDTNAFGIMNVEFYTQ